MLKLIKYRIKSKGEVVSSLEFYVVHLPSRRLGVIEEVWTREDKRRRGLATRLLNKAINKGKELGLDCIELTVRQDKPNIQDFYKNLGFQDRLNLCYRLWIH